ncbi:hypothetical protein V8E51_005150 [Hyaloscypha variabilis]
MKSLLLLTLLATCLAAPFAGPVASDTRDIAVAERELVRYTPIHAGAEGEARVKKLFRYAPVHAGPEDERPAK